MNFHKVKLLLCHSQIRLIIMVGHLDWESGLGIGIVDWDWALESGIWIGD